MIRSASTGSSTARRAHRAQVDRDERLIVDTASEGDGSETIDVVILTWNDGGLLDCAVDSVHASIGVRVRCIVVDNGSDPPARPVLADTDLLVRLETNSGVAAGRNIGARHATAPLVCFLDSDAVLRPDTLRVLSDALLRDPDLALVAPVFDGQEPTDSGGLAPTFGRKLGRVTGRTDAYEPGRPHSGLIGVDFAIGACQLFRREAFDHVDGLDERYFYGPEDADFCMRLRLDGWRVAQVPAARCEHPPRRRNRGVLTVGGLRHAVAVLRFLWRHRRYRRRVPTP